MDGEIRAELDRIHDEDKRQNKRIEYLEKAEADNRDLLITVKELAITSKYTAEKVDAIDNRLGTLEKEPVTMVKNAKDTVIKTVVAFVVGAILSAIVMAVKGGAI